eukprot:Lithocolla_globosa_v1_NODE_9293_length_724_cov_3.796712.p1 type:complete len:137 gc:universal NODE_9293_length_724_cov_3.796712:455-45(-)
MEGIVDSEVETVSKRQRIVNELLETEQTYVATLLALKKYFMEPLKMSGLLPSKMIPVVFSNLDDLVGVNTELLNQLTQRVGETEWANSRECLGDVLLRLAPFLKLYTTYVKNYDQGIATVIIPYFFFFWRIQKEKV